MSFIHNNDQHGEIRIPSERFLSEELNVSRTTVKYAIDKMVEDRVLYKVHGKGTFVNSEMNLSRIVINKNVPDAFTLNVRSRGLELETIVLSSKVLYDYPEFKHIFPKEVKDFYELRRIRIVSKKNYSVETSYFPFKLFPDANRYDFSKHSLYEYMETKGHKPEKFQKSIQVESNSQVNELLNLDKNTLLFFEKYIAYTENNTVIEYTEAYTDSSLVEYDFII